jgi:hypothetical protein
MKLTNPFWKDVLSSYHLAKPYTKLNTDELLSLDILNFVPVTDLNGAIAIIRQSDSPIVQQFDGLIVRQSDSPTNALN